MLEEVLKGRDARPISVYCAQLVDGNTASALQKRWTSILNWTDFCMAWEPKDREQAQQRDFVEWWICHLHQSQTPMTDIYCNKALLKASMASASETMLEAGREIHEQKSENADGISAWSFLWWSWNLAEEKSLINEWLCETLSMDTGKCLDIEVLSKVCRGCERHENQQDTEEKKVWQAEHVGKCKANYTGSEPSMETEGRCIKVNIPTQWRKT